VSVERATQLREPRPAARAGTPLPAPAPGTERARLRLLHVAMEQDIRFPLPETAPVADDALWYKDAVIYQLHIKAFFDSNDAGNGVFRRLPETLVFVGDLGLNAIWLLPFSPSPLKDEGHNVPAYQNVPPQ